MIANRLTEQELKLSDIEWLQIFAPQSHEAVKDSHRILTKKRAEIENELDEACAAIDAESEDEDYRWFWRAALNAKYKYDERLRDIDSQLTRLRRYLRIINGAPIPKGAVTSDLIQAAKEVPIESLFSQEFRRSGNKLQGLCPFVEEKTPSFFVYKSTNRCWCFGCQQGYGVIDTYMKLNECNFNEAVLALTGSEK